MVQPGQHGAPTHVPWWLYALDKVRRMILDPLTYIENISFPDQRDSHVVDRFPCPLHALSRRCVLCGECSPLLRNGEDHQEARAPAPPGSDDSREAEEDIRVSS